MKSSASVRVGTSVADSVSLRVWKILKKAASKSWSGFTLAELIVVVAILAILATVGFLAFSGYVDDARDAASKSNVRSILSAIRSESALTGNSPRRYIVHDASLSGVALSGAFVEISGERTYLTWGNWNVPNTNYSAGNPDWTALKLDASKFKIAKSNPVQFFDEATALYDAKSVLLWAADSLERTWSKPRTVTLLQGAAILPSGTAYVTGDAPSFSTATGASLSLIRDPAQGSSTGALVDEASVSVPASVAPSSTPYALANSIRFDSSRSPSLTRTYSVSGSWAGQKFTMSKWIKRGKLGTQQSLLFVDSGTAWWSTGLEFTAGDQLRLYTYYGLSTTRYGWYTTQVFRDPGAWMHVVLSVDTSQPVAADREKLYVNGVRVTSFSPEASGYAIQNMQTYVMNSTAGAHSIASSSPFDGYLSDVNWVDWQALDASSFGENDPVSGSWKPKQYAGAYGVNGFRLDFSSGATAAWLGLDASPIAATGHVAPNNWTPTAGIAVTDQVADTPLNSFSTLNPLVNKSLAWAGVWNGSVANGNLAISSNGTSNFNSYGTQLIWPNSGKVYWEVKNSVGGTAGYYPISGLAPESNLTSSYYWWLSNGEGGFAQYADGNVLVLWTSVFSTTAPGATWTIGYAFDPSNGKYWISINGVWQNSWNPAGGTGNVGTLPTGVNYVPAFSMAGAGSAAVANFGQWGSSGLTYSADAGGYFKYAPPAGFKALSTANAPAVAVANAKSAFDVLTWTGDGADGRDVSGLSFSPDILWFKARTNGNYPALFDSVRGAGKGMFSNSAQGDTDWSSIMKSFNSYGFKVWTDSAVNSAGQTYVAWNWKAGWASVANSVWTIPSSVSANPAAGISIVSYTWTSANATIGHWLSNAPKMVLYKARSWSTGWATYFSSIGPTYQIWLNATNGKYTPADFNSTNPTSTTLAVGPQNEVNQSTVGYVAYAFSEVPGFSKFGSYVGNNSTEWPFVYTGFAPKYVMVKRVDAASDWFVLDAGRSPANPMSSTLGMNQAFAESSYAATSYVDRLSNGFKIRQDSVNGYENISWGAYVYAAFAEAPFAGAWIAPGTAK